VKIYDRFSFIFTDLFEKNSTGKSFSESKLLSLPPSTNLLSKVITLAKMPVSTLE